MSGDFLISLKLYYYVLSKKPRLLLNFIRYADSSGPELSAIELGCEMALPEPFLDVMLVKKLQIQLGSGTYVNTLPTTSVLTEASVNNEMALTETK